MLVHRQEAAVSGQSAGVRKALPQYDHKIQLDTATVAMKCWPSQGSILVSVCKAASSSRGLAGGLGGQTLHVQRSYLTFTVPQPPRSSADVYTQIALLSLAVCATVWLLVAVQGASAEIGQPNDRNCRTKSL